MIHLSLPKLINLYLSFIFHIGRGQCWPPKFPLFLQHNISRSELKPTETIEKVALPDDEVISSEKQHQELITGVQAGVDLKKTDTREPINPLDLAKLETSKDQVEEEIQAFDR